MPWFPSSSRRRGRANSTSRSRCRRRGLDRPWPCQGRAGRQSRRQGGRHVLPDRSRCGARDRHRQGRRRPRRHPPLDGAPARLRGEGAVSRRAGDDRSGDRGWLLLRLLLQAAVHARGSGGDRAADGGTREEGRAGRALGNAARRSGAISSKRWASTTRRRSSRRFRATNRFRSTARAPSSTFAAARTCRRPASSRCSS